MDVKTKILIVDDEPINLDFFDVMLSKLGFEVQKAEDGEEALGMIQGDKPDLIILDNIMPKISGWKLTRLLKNEPEYTEFQDIPIIMFSAMDDVKDKIEGFELGIEDYITKPFNFSEVLARIRAVLRGKELSRQIVKKERHIIQIESLNKSLVYFTQHLKDPVVELQNISETLDVTNSEAVVNFIDQVKKGTKEILASLDGLADEIQELESANDESDSENILKELEEKFQKHFATIRNQ